MGVAAVDEEVAQAVGAAACQQAVYPPGRAAHRPQNGPSEGR